MSGGETPPRRRRCSDPSSDLESVRVKQEPEDDIKDYAETTMNELLGWYGYGKVDSRDTQGLNLQHFATVTSPVTSVSTPDGSGSEDTSRDTLHPSTGKSSSNGPISVDSPKSESGQGRSERSSLANDPVVIQHQKLVSALANLPKPPESPNLPPGCVVCAWCQKVGMKLFTLKTTNGSKAFCSELCFTQCRRASFKKNKVCDWCKHVRHTVNYVDFQDGEQQLQFCSDKCLNQYKMNIFCKETQAHLQLHPHLQDAACKVTPSGSMNLITPELWLKDCKNGPKTNEDDTEETSVQDEIDVVNTKQCVTRKEKEKGKRSNRQSGSRQSKEGSIENRQTPATPALGISPHRRQSPCTPSDYQRPPFLPPYPSFLAQQQLDAYLRLQHSRFGGPPIPLPHGPLHPFPPGTNPHPPLHPASYSTPSASLLPPVTVAVPYPILIPLPIPVPIIIPLLLGLSEKLQEEKKQEARKASNIKKTNSKVGDDSSDSSQVEDDTTEDDSDCTKTTRKEKRPLQEGKYRELKRKCTRRKLNSM